MENRQRRRLTSHDLRLKVRNAGLATLLDTSQPFRQFVWTILIEAGIFAPTHRQGQPDTSAYMEGRRALGLEVLHMLRAIRPDVLALLEREGSLLEKQAQPQSPGDDDERPTDEP